MKPKYGLKTAAYCSTPNSANASITSLQDRSIKRFPPLPNFHLVNSATLCRFAGKDKLQLFSKTMEEIDQVMAKGLK